MTQFGAPVGGKIAIEKENPTADLAFLLPFPEEAAEGPADRIHKAKLDHADTAPC